MRSRLNWELQGSKFLMPYGAAGRTHRQFVRLSTPRLARTAAGEVYGWGRADSSQLGLGSGAEATEARDTPVRVPAG